VVVNTVLALCTSCVGAFIASSIMHDNKGRFEMEDILNASLAGGVMIGSSSDLVVHGVVSMAVGLVAGLFCTWGYANI